MHTWPYYFIEFSDRVVVTPSDQFTPLQIRPARNKIHALVDRLRSYDESISSEIHKIFADYSRKRAISSSSAVPDEFSCRETVELILIVHNNCNLACKYCLDGQETYQKHKSFKMTVNTALKAFDYFASRLTANDRIRVTFFGGEPLLNWTMIEQVVGAILERSQASSAPSTEFAIQSNLTNLTRSQAEKFKEFGFNVTANIDGDEEIHNSIRPARNKDLNSYLSTLRALSLLREIDVPFFLRCTVTSANVLMLDKIYDIHSALGAARSAFALLRPVNSDGVSLDAPLRPNLAELKISLKKIMRQHPECFEEYLDFYSRSAFHVNGLCNAAHLRTPTIDVSGDVYACPWFVGQEKLRLGSILQNSLDVNIQYSALDQFNAAQDEICAGCSINKLCSGACGVSRVLDQIGVADKSDRDWARAQQCVFTEAALEVALEAYF